MYERPVIFEHPTIENGRGERLQFRELTNRPCKQCSEGKLGVYMEDSMTTTLHCIACDYMENLKKDDFREVQRLISSGAIPDPYAPKPRFADEEPEPASEPEPEAAPASSGTASISEL